MNDPLWLAVWAAWAAVIVSIITAIVTVRVNKQNLKHSREAELRQRQMEFYNEILGLADQIHAETEVGSTGPHDLVRLRRAAHGLTYRALALGVPEVPRQAIQCFDDAVGPLLGLVGEAEIELALWDVTTYLRMTVGGEIQGRPYPTQEAHKVRADDALEWAKAAYISLRAEAEPEDEVPSAPVTKITASWYDTLLKRLQSARSPEPPGMNEEGPQARTPGGPPTH